MRATRSGKILKPTDDLPPIDSADEDADGYQSESFIEDSSMSPLKSKGKIKKGQAPKTTGSQDEVPIKNNLGTGFSKKRNFENF